MRPRWILASVVCVLAACAAPTSIEAPLVPETTRLHEGAPSAIVPLADGRVLVDDAAGLWIVGGTGIEPERVGESGELGAIRAWTILDGATLIAGEDAVVLVRGSSLGAAPLASALGGESIHALASTPRPGSVSDLWIATSGGLRLFRDEALSPIEIDGVDLGDAEIAAAGEGEIWAVADGSLLRIAVDDGVIATRFDRPIDVTALASDDRGVPWVIAGGTLHAIEGGALLRFELGGELETVLASGDGPDVWIAGAGGAFHATRRTARPVDAELGTSMPLPGVDGEAFVADGDGVIRLRARHRLALEGLHAGAQLTDVTPVAIVTEVTGATLEATIDRAPVELDGTSLTLDPGTLAIGEHTLEIVARWSDGTLPVTTSAHFSIAPSVTWTAHIQPLYAEHCSMCHGAAGPSPTRLDSREAWETLSVRILDNIRTGRMPLGATEPLDPELVELVDTWSRTGFPE